MVGNSGSGKTHLARRLARALGVPLFELDGIHHRPGWRPIDPEEFTAAVTRIAAGDDWVVDGNYRAVVSAGPVWRRADTVVWVDPPRRTVMRQVTTRTLVRTLTRQELWNGNREPLSNLWSWDPEKSIIRWAWTRHGEYRSRYLAAASDPAFGHLTFVRLTSRREADDWLAGLTGDGTSS